MDAFFASVEQLDHPELRGKPVLVGHDGPRGVVAAASYEARKFGCHSAQPMSLAKRLCPHAVIVSGHHHRYRDITGSLRALGPAPQIARQIKDTVKRETGLTASVGVAPNKFLAKLASDL